MTKSPIKLPSPVFNDEKHHIRLYQGDCLALLALIPESSVDLVFADPPYFLSNGGITCHAGRMVSVNKGDWDKSKGPDANHDFNRAWLAACQRVLKPNGSIWVSGTAHVIHSVGFAMQQLGFKLLNDISWVKPNPPPNLSCRYFTHATETIIWAARDKKSRHTFNYKLMKETNRGKQMKSVWEIKPPESWEKRFGKHPTQKPVASGSGASTSSRMMSISGWASRAPVMWAAKAPRSTANALPAGTRVARAAAMIRESSRRISSLSSPTADSRASARRELLHTSSPKNGDWCAGENFTGFISKRRTRTPRRAACQAASLPARPPPIMVMAGFSVFGFRFSVVINYRVMFLGSGFWVAFCG